MKAILNGCERFEGANRDRKNREEISELLLESLSMIRDQRFFGTISRPYKIHRLNSKIVRMTITGLRSYVTKCEFEIDLEDDDVIVKYHMNFKSLMVCSSIGVAWLFIVPIVLVLVMHIQIEFQSVVILFSIAVFGSLFLYIVGYKIDVSSVKYHLKREFGHRLERAPKT